MTKKTNIAAVLLIAPTMIPFSPSHAVETGTQTNNVALIAPVANAELASTPTPSPAPTGSETPAPAPSPVPTETPTPIPAPSDPPIDDTPVPAPPTFSEEDVTIIQGSNKEFVVSGYQESGVEVTFTLRDSSDSVVEIRNSSGDLVSEITRETNEDGLVKFTLDTSDLPLGVYVLTAAAVDTESATSKIQVQAPPVETPAPPVETPAPPVKAITPALPEEPTTSSDHRETKAPASLPAVAQTPHRSTPSLEFDNQLSASLPTAPSTRGPLEVLEFTENLQAAPAPERNLQEKTEAPTPNTPVPTRSTTSELGNEYAQPARNFSFFSGIWFWALSVLALGAGALYIVFKKRMKEGDEEV